MKGFEGTLSWVYLLSETVCWAGSGRQVISGVRKKGNLLVSLTIRDLTSFGVKPSPIIADLAILVQGCVPS